MSTAGYISLATNAGIDVYEFQASNDSDNIESSALSFS